MAGFDPVAAHRNAGIPVSGRSWSDFSADGDDLASVIFERCTFTRVRFERTGFMGAMFIDCRFDECTFHDCDLERAQWVECRGALVRITGEGTRCVQSTFVSCTFDALEIGVSADRLILAESTIARLTFSGPGLSQHAPTFSKLSVDRFDAQEARWLYASALEAPLASWSIEGASFERCAFIEADAAGADLSTVRIERCSFHKSSFDRAVVRSAPGSIFSSCAISGLDATEAALEGALFERVDCEGARFERAHLSRRCWCDRSGDRATSPAPSPPGAPGSAAPSPGAACAPFALRSPRSGAASSTTPTRRGRSSSARICTVWKVPWPEPISRAARAPSSGGRSASGGSTREGLPVPRDRRPEASASPEPQESPEATEAAGRSVLARLLNEEDRAPSGEVREPEFREAVVESWAGSRGALRGGTPAVLAPSCLLVPRCGDTVVAWTRPGAPAYLTAVLVRADSQAPAEINLGACATVDASRLSLRAEHVTVAAREILTNAAAHHAVTGTKTEHVETRVADVGRDVRRAGHVSDEVTGTLLQRAGMWLSNVAREARLHAKATLFD